MKLRKELLEKFQSEYAQLKNAENLDELYPKEKVEKAFSETGFTTKVDEYAKALAVVAAKYNQMNAGQPEDIKMLQGMTSNVYNIVSELEHIQIQKVLRYRDKIGEIESISSDGEVDTENEEILKQEEENPLSEMDSWGENISEQYSNEIYIDEKDSTLDYVYGNDPRGDYETMVYAKAIATDAENPDKCVLFGYKFFNTLLEEKDSMQERIKDKDFLYGERAKEDLNIPAPAEDVDPIEAANFDAVTRLTTYMTLNKRSQERSFLDVLKHPINSFREWKLKNNLAKDLEKRYGLNKETLGKMEKMVLDTENPKNSRGIEEVQKDFVFMRKNGEMITTTSHTKDQILEIAKHDYPQDPNFDAVMERRAQERAEKEKQMQEEYEPSEEEFSEQIGKDLNAEKSPEEKTSPFAQGMFLSNGVVTNITVIDNNAPKDIQ